MTDGSGGGRQGDLYPDYDHMFYALSGRRPDKFDVYRETMLLDYGYQTARAYWGDLDSWRFWCLQQIPVCNPLSPTTEEITRFLGDLLTMGYSPNTVARRLTALRLLVAILLAKGELTADPTTKVKPIRRRKNKTPPAT